MLKVDTDTSETEMDRPILGTKRYWHHHPSSTSPENVIEQLSFRGKLGQDSDFSVFVSTNLHRQRGADDLVPSQDDVKYAEPMRAAP